MTAKVRGWIPIDSMVDLSTSQNGFQKRPDDHSHGNGNHACSMMNSQVALVFQEFLGKIDAQFFRQFLDGDLEN
jgi:hypothetical protein